MITIDTLSKKVLATLRAGDVVSYSGKMLVMRDAAHKKIYDLILSGEKLPVDFDGKLIYYMGPCPAINGQIVGSAGPTTSKRMDAYAPSIYDLGLVATIGKGTRSKAVYDSIVRNKAGYFAAVGGAGAFYSKRIVDKKLIAYPELLSEAIIEITVVDFQMLLAIDSYGGKL